MLFFFFDEIIQHEFILDWIVGYSSTEHYNLTQKLVYTIPGLLQRHSSNEWPEAKGWMYLSQDNSWIYDPLVSVTVLTPRPIGLRGAFPCSVEQNTDYPGNDINKTRYEK